MHVSVTSGTERWIEDLSPPIQLSLPTEADAPDAPGVCDAVSIANEATRRREIALAYEPFPKQRAFHASRAKYRLFGGAAGPGKSKALLIEAILQAHEHPRADTLLLRRTFPELEQSLLLYFRRDVPRELYQTFHESKHLVTWWNGSTTRFGYCASEYDVYQYQGAEFLFIGVDELTMFTLRQWQFLTSRNRAPHAGAFPCMAGATNPGNIGHAWVKSLWIDKQPASGMDDPAAYDAADYEFIAARVEDNPIYARDENYLKTLRALPSHLRRAFLDGDWDVFAGQYFDKFDTSRHVARAEQIDWKPWWPRWISVDWGFEHPSAAYWHTAVPQGNANVILSRATPKADPSGKSGLRDDNAADWNASVNGTELPTDETAARLKKAVATTATATSGDGAIGSGASAHGRRIVTYREYVTHRTPPRELARQIVERSVHSGSAMTAARMGTSAAMRHSERSANYPFESAGEREQIDAIYLSPDAFARRTDEASIADQMGDVFVAAGLPRPVPADNDRVGGWMLMYQMLEAREWLLTDNCIELIRTLPNLVRDPARIEDVEKMDGDDPADAARYGLKSRYGAHHGGSGARMPLAARLAERVTSADPTVRAIQARIAELEESRRCKPVSFVHRRR